MPVITEQKRNFVKKLVTPVSRASASISSSDQKNKSHPSKNKTSNGDPGALFENRLGLMSDLRKSLIPKDFS
jgi:hypothetical protein